MKWCLPSRSFFLLVLSTGSTYAGIRHALPVVVLLAVFAGVGFEMALSSQTWQLKILVGLAFVAAAASALPQMRPWEYFNEFVGATTNAHTSFSDEAATRDSSNMNGQDCSASPFGLACLH
ncbi:MAG: hypothetical protein ABSF15_22860 [Candidatus Sulfotelmatobacter sp.]